MWVILLALGRVAANSGANVLQKQLTASGAPALKVNFLSYLGLSAAALVLALFQPWTEFSGRFWCFAVLTGLFGALGNGFLVTALKHGELSVLGPVNAYKSVVALLAGIFLLGELPAPGGLAGMTLIIGGSYLVLDTLPERFSLKLLKRRDIRYRLFALVFTALEAVMIKNLILVSSPAAAFVIWCCFGAFFAGFLALPVRGRGAPIDRKRLLALVGCLGAMQLLTNYVFRYLEVGYALALFQLSLVLNVWLGYRFFHETDLARKILGAAVMLAGSVLIIFFGR